ncbi:exodeoxyribonuclease V subunit beta [uncultured Pedobacter sp.]|uniref:UvrD-helicase domain-containing protein n=1 Tax=uncultured Pedobacter sp. TaxID=246139 RepID=UPI00261A34EF|nr:UvrD-helicase domain-containing protein [uncultured Pedobacter sp.]
MQKPLKILQASAGSGKTFSLAAHYLTLLFSGENKYREILAVTFTNKATEEMKERILTVLESFAKGDKSKEIEDYRQIVLAAHPSLSAKELQLKADKVYRKILHDYSRFAVSTIDGFVQKVIRGFAFELGLDSGYTLEMNEAKVTQELTHRLNRLLDEDENLLQWVVALALERISNDKSWNYTKELKDLTKEVFGNNFKRFEEAVKSFGINNIDEVFKQYIDFSKNSIKEFESTVSDLAINANHLVQNTSVDVEVLNKTKTGQLFKLLNIANKDYKGFDGLRKLVNEPDNWFKKGKTSSFYEEINPSVEQLVKTFDDGIAQYLLNKAFLKNGYYLRLMQEMTALLAQYREEKEVLLISDAQKLLNGIADDLGDNPSFIWEKMGNKYHHFLFDEFQDTSSKQWDSFKALLSNAIATHNGKQNDHLIVGDVKQSIYRWRDGDYKLLHHQAKADVGAINVINQSLQENYRSTEEIISFNNELYERIAPIIQEKINNQINEEDGLLQDFWHNEQNQYANIITSIYQGVAQKTHAKTKAGGVVKIKKIQFSKNDNKEELEDNPESKKEAMLMEMVREIKALLGEHGYQQREIGVLVRTNNEASEVVNALMDVGLDVISGEALKIANSSAVQLIINVLALLVATPENATLYKANCIALNAKIKEKTINGDIYIGLKEANISSLTAALPPVFCENYTTWSSLSVPVLVEKIIAAFELDRYQKDGTNSFMPYLLAFRDLCAKTSQQGEKGISSFLVWWHEEGVNKNLPSPETANAIQVTTIAKSKGLAYRAVFIPFCDWSLGGKPNATFWLPTQETPYANLAHIPLQFTSALKASAVGKYYLEELLFNHMDALNNLYVATTRAKDYIYISIVGKAKPSLTNIGDAILAVYEGEFENADELQIGAYSEISDQKKTADLIDLTTYPTSSRLEEIYEEPETRPKKYIDNITQSGKKGSVLHQILAEINQIDEIPKALEKQVLEGVISKDESTDYAAQLKAVLTHPELSVLLAKSALQINEKTIIDTDGKPYRPDKLLVTGHEATVIDYKFTAQESDKHVEQIKKYKSLISALGYSHVKAYLFYNASKKLKEVN